MLDASQKLFLQWMAGYTPPGLRGEGGSPNQVIGPHGLWLVPVVTTLGGLLSGWLVYTFAPEAEGHGTDTVVKALHWTGGTIRARVAPLKMVASAITIGSGGSAGREGPTALIAAGFGSMYATWLNRPTRERRLLVLMGMAAGLSAIFRSPIGTALFAVEVLYSGIEFESEGLLYCMLAAIVAYAVNGAFVGFKPLFTVPGQFPPTQLTHYLWYIALGAASGLVATVLPEVFYRMRDGFHALPIPPWIKPAIGGLLVGLIALKLPQVLAGGYGWMQQAMDGQMALRLLLILLGAKMIAFSLTVSSGGSGGVFAPSLFVGAMLGGVFSGLSHHAPAGLVIVGMAAVFGGAARVPIATLLMVVEMTGGYALLVPAGLAVMLSFVIQKNLSRFVKYGSMYEAQVAGRADSPAHQAEQVEVAMRLLEHGGIAWPSEVTHVHLAALLQSGLELDLPDGSRLTAGVLRPKSKWAGKQIRVRPVDGAVSHSRIVSVLRGKNVLLAKPDLVLLPGDRLIVVVQPEGIDSLATELAPIGEGDGDGSHLSHEEMAAG
ncbi:chloride channel protein [Granulicella sp. 5B5]|uniref:chloride channel protein n=1 Tax=Granulicella sp. 5B5 TaxID=1617967 RepID=UPI001768E1A1|nr:chloride channel protein [Granulicella sp. 5B5]QMV19936.1 chloride channel protein [Granulicella sp. 5B5]